MELVSRERRPFLAVIRSHCHLTLPCSAVSVSSSPSAGRQQLEGGKTESFPKNTGHPKVFCHSPALWQWKTVHVPQQNIAEMSKLNAQVTMKCYTNAYVTFSWGTPTSKAQNFLAWLDFASNIWLDLYHHQHRIRNGTKEGPRSFEEEHTEDNILKF